MNSTGNEYQTHQFSVHSQRGIYKVTIAENTNSALTNCTCGGIQKCPHVLQVLAGISTNLPAEHIADLQKLHERLEQTIHGKNIISKAQKHLHFQQKCPACASVSIVRMPGIQKVMLSLMVRGKIIGYKCSDCKQKW